MRLMNDLTIGGRRIGPGHSTYVVAEMSANHGNDLKRAIAIIEAAKSAGADAIKLQTYTADTLTIACDSPLFRISGTLWHDRRLYELYQEASTPWEWHRELKATANGLGLELFSTPFDSSAVEFLETLDVPAFKIASFEAVDLPLLKRVAQTGKPVIMSTGMATLEEINEAVETLAAAGATQLALLKCTSAYPASPDDMNLRTIEDLTDRFELPIGLSDHTMDLAVPVAAVTLGACIIEKHLTLSRSFPSPDSGFSLEPQEFKAMVDAVRTTERALGSVQYSVSSSEEKVRVFRRSLFVVEDVKAGDSFTAANVRSIRPGYGLHTRHLPEVLGRRATRDVSRGTPMSWELLS